VLLFTTEPERLVLLGLLQYVLTTEQAGRPAAAAAAVCQSCCCYRLTAEQAAA